MRNLPATSLLLLGLAVASGAPARAQTPASGGPGYAADGKLVRPGDYREWVYLTSGLGMT